ncbi:RTA1 domain-containing protein [Ascoidea rubescens DSM 1968]|uniref:Sphingoid long-chain base transporter RSB1 n=1 Tax=Ascoidea rubescens DSM 1968 TaxID=1344418 RepID=A0A1D2VG32_9ASCO|nr:RTA1-domain-containing protein [Ascoidea rubescens DSM 1968]ODV60611.1 RTA1-domain-containing protein [Ascoidea rubescens DSM 1968]
MLAPTEALASSSITGTPAFATAAARNFYGSTPNFAGNLTFAIVMGVLFIVHSILAVTYKQRYFGLSFIFGAGLEFATYIGRTLANGDPTSTKYFLLQIIAINLAPVFLMAGNYYLLGKLVIIYGEYYSILTPIAYSYIFIVCDVVGLFLQSAGGAAAGKALNDKSRRISDNSSNIILGGIAFQVFSMSIFLFFWTHFLYSIYIKTNTLLLKYNSSTNNNSIGNNNSDVQNGNGNGKIFTLFQKFYNFIDTSSKDHLFNLNYKEIRKNKILIYFPLVLTISVLLIYTRSVYKLIMLALKIAGHGNNSEIHFFLLESLLMALSILILAFCYPGYVMDGRHSKIVVGKRIRLRDFKIVKKDFDSFIRQFENESTNQENDSMSFTIKNNSPVEIEKTV